MKKELLSFAAVLFILAGCDKVDKAIQRVPDADSGGGTPAAKHKVLLEDYTGHQCGYCPRAADVATALHEQHGDPLVIVAVHAGYWTLTSKKYPTSYTTTVGNEWNEHYVGQNGSYPCGMVNRRDFGGGVVSNDSKWSSMVSNALAEPFIVDLSLSQEYSASDRSLDVTVKALFRQSYDKNLMLTVVLTEDNIVGPQTDYRDPSKHIEEYVFNHMLRDNISGAWGKQITDSPKMAGDSIVVSFNDFKINQKFNDKHLNVVAFVSEKESREVIEAETVKVGAEKQSL